MKYLIFFLTVLLISCTEESPAFQVSDKPFIIGEIRSYNDDVCVYIAKDHHSFDGSDFKASFYAKTNLFQIGDTVKVCR